MGVLAKTAFIMNLPVDATYNSATGVTIVTYQYQDATYYVLESALEHLAVNGDWATTYT